MFSCYFNPIQVTIFNILFRHLIGSTDTQPINIFYNTSAPVGNAIFDHMTVAASITVFSREGRVYRDVLKDG